MRKLVFSQIVYVQNNRSKYGVIFLRSEAGASADVLRTLNLRVTQHHKGQVLRT